MPVEVVKLSEPTTTPDGIDSNERADSFCLVAEVLEARPG
jgi:hypothetical protein